MTRRKHPPLPTKAPRPQPQGRPPISVDDVMSELRGIPGTGGDAETRIRAYLEEKVRDYPEWWANQSVRRLAEYAQVFGVSHAS